MEFEQALHAGALLGGEFELVGEFENVQWPRIAVQFGRQRQAHAAAGAEVGDLLLGKRLDRARLHPGIKGLCMHARDESDGCNYGPNLHRHSPAGLILRGQCFASGACNTVLQAGGSAAMVIGGFGFGGTAGGLG